MQATREIRAKENFSLDEICQMGDDIINLPAMRECGLAIAAILWQQIEPKSR